MFLTAVQNFRTIKDGHFQGVADITHIEWPDIKFFLQGFLLIFVSLRFKFKIVIPNVAKIKNMEFKPILKEILSHIFSRNFYICWDTFHIFFEIREIMSLENKSSLKMFGGFYKYLYFIVQFIWINFQDKQYVFICKIFSLSSLTYWLKCFYWRKICI